MLAKVNLVRPALDGAIAVQMNSAAIGKSRARGCPGTRVEGLLDVGQAVVFQQPWIEPVAVEAAIACDPVAIEINIV
jgi:hypothetical protein